MTMHKMESGDFCNAGHSTNMKVPELIRRFVVATETARKLGYTEVSTVLLEDTVARAIDEFPELREYVDRMTNHLVESCTIHGGPQ